MRGGVTVDVSWKNGKPTSATFKVDKSAPGAVGRRIEVTYAGKTIVELAAGSGNTQTITTF